ncbi:dihydroneopterin aldolase [Nocardioides speluncae]|uniref:dihydroneopterin aldolase n=1 Tax=Nocardioides speluncae TaxID=2670337 RepID=UPI000D69B6D6|nr:dihydroneopterin aldolase [Nocardioides speluncae]
MDHIEIDGLRLRCVIGVTAEERRDRSDVTVDLRLGVDTRAVADSDAIEDAWNYRTVTKAVIAHVEQSSYRTVEALAAALARICIVDYGAQWVEASVHKPGALRFADSVGVCISRKPDDFRESPGTEVGQSNVGAVSA